MKSKQDNTPRPGFSGRMEIDEREVELPTDVGSPEQGLESDQLPPSNSDVQRDTNHARAPMSRRRRREGRKELKQP